MGQRDSYENDYFSVVYLSAVMAQVTCPRCGHEYQILRDSLQTRLARKQELPFHCLDCKWMVRRDNANKA